MSSGEDLAGVRRAYGSGPKRVLDLLIAIPLALLTFPIIGLAALAIKIETGGPVLFVQVRIGKHGVPFSLKKLRSMVEVCSSTQAEVWAGDARVTRVGAVLRRLKIDELPQLWNVLRGEMSIVGPRPCLPELLEKFDENGWKRLEVNPGLTGLAQVSGNIYLSWPERWRLDAKYVRTMSLALDIAILLKTLSLIVLGEKRFLQR
jgi:undecaprenyl phosphate N,N'-diacetylbacillosamine 1-phosphate transferase